MLRSSLSGIMEVSSTISGEGVESSTSDMNKYEWGRLAKIPPKWEAKKAAIWICPDCSKTHTKWTDLRTGNRYYPWRVKCSECDFKARDGSKYVSNWLERRKEAKQMVEMMNSARRKR